MALIEYKIPYRGCLPSCRGVGEAQVGEEFKFTPDQTKNASWPDYVKYELKQVLKEDADIIAAGFIGYDRVYVFEIEDSIYAVGTGQQTVDQCTFIETLICWECCDDLEPRIKALEDAPPSVTESEQLSVAYTGGNPLAAPVDPIEGWTHIERYSNGDVIFSYDHDAAVWIPVFVRTETDNTLTLVSQTVVDGDTVLTWQYVDINGAPIGAPFDTVIPGDTDIELCDRLQQAIANGCIVPVLSLDNANNNDLVLTIEDDQGNPLVSSTLNMPGSEIVITNNPDGSITYEHISRDGITTVSWTTRAPSEVTSVVNPDGSTTYVHDDGSGNTTSWTTRASSEVTSVVNPDGSITYVHDDGSGNTTSWTTRAPSSITPQVGNAQPQVHNDGVGNLVELDPFDPSTTNLTQNNQAAAIEELALQQQVESSDFVGSAAPVPFDRNVGLEVNAHFGVNTATFGTAPAAGESLRLGNKIQITGLVSNEITNAELLLGNTVTVDGVTGRDARGYTINGDPFVASDYDTFRPFATLQAADNARLEDQNLLVRAGVYASLISTKGGGFDFAPNVTLNTLTVIPSPTDLTITGRPNMQAMSVFLDDNANMSADLGQVTNGPVDIRSEGNGKVNITVGGITNLNGVGGGRGLRLRSTDATLINTDFYATVEGDITIVTTGEFARGGIQTQSVGANAHVNFKDVILLNSNGWGIFAGYANAGVRRKYSAIGRDLLVDVATKTAVDGGVIYTDFNDNGSFTFRDGIAPSGFYTGGTSVVEVEARLIEAYGNKDIDINAFNKSTAFTVDGNTTCHADVRVIKQTNPAGPSTHFINNNSRVTHTDTIFETANPNKPTFSTNDGDCQLTLNNCYVRQTHTVAFEGIAGQSQRVYLRDTQFPHAFTGAEDVVILTGTWQVTPLANMPPAL